MTMRRPFVPAILCILLTITSGKAEAQDNWNRLLTDPFANVLAVDDAFNQWADTARANVAGRAADDETLKRFRKLEKRYFRWRRDAEKRMDASGQQSHENLWREFHERQASAGQRSQLGQWVSIGPTMDTTLHGLGVVSAIAFHPTNDSIIYIGTWSSGSWWTSDQGASWQRVSGFPGGGVPTFDPVDGNVLYMFVGGQLHRSTDGGDTWAQLPMEDAGFLYGAAILIDPTNTQQIDLISYGHSIRSTDGGQTWAPLNDLLLTSVTLHVSDPNIRYALITRTDGAVSDAFVRSTDGGVTYDTLTLLADDNIARVVSVTEADPDRIYVYFPGPYSTGTGRVAVSYDGGENFTMQPGSDLLRSFGSMFPMQCSPVNPDLVFAGSIFLRRSMDAGLTWQAIHQADFALPNYMHVDHRAFAFNDGVPWSCNDGGIYRSLDDGTSWEDRTNNLILSPITDFDWSPTDPEVIVFGAEHNSFALHIDGQWRGYGYGDGYNVAVDPNNPYHAIGCTQYGDPDLTLDVSLEMNFANGVTESGYGFSANKPSAFDPSDGNVVYSLRNNVFKSTDGGLNYTQVSSFAQDAGGGFLLVHPTATQNVYTAYHRSQDGGAAWSSLNPPVRPIRCLTVDPADPDRIWSVGGNGHAYVHYTSDGGASWQELNTIDIPATNGIRIARVENGHDGLLVAQGSALFYIDDRFSNWQPADNSLPGAITDMAVHPISQVAMVSTFGSGLWQASTEVDMDGLPEAAAIASRTTICPGQTVQFFDNSLNSGPGFGSVYQWTFAGGSPATSTEASPVVQYDTEGVYDVSLVLQTANGEDTVVYTGMITVSVPIVPLPWSEGFKDPVFPPASWFWWDPDQYPYNGWKRLSGTSVGGYGLSASAAQFTTPTSLYGWEILMTPAFDLSDPSGWMLIFDRAYQPSLSASTYDTLRVYATGICDLTGPLLYERGGEGLGTAEASNFFFVPDSSEWRTDTLFLSGIAPSSQLRFGFAGESNDGNPIFIDNVRLVLDPSTGIAANKGLDVQLVPNPADEELQVRLTHAPARDAFLELFDLTGRKLMHVPFRGVDRVRLATGALADGTYVVHIVDGGHVLGRRFVKQAR